MGKTISSATAGTPLKQDTNTGAVATNNYNGVIPIDSSTVFETDVCELTEEHLTTINGRNVSGRKWKVRPQKRASSLVKTSINNNTKTWESRNAERLQRQEALALQEELKQQRILALREKRERREENERRRSEKEFENTSRSVQTLNRNKLGSTLKSMSKKQLRQIKKTRVNSKTGATEYVSAYAKS
jgi:rRNA-processing protein CGR1